MAGKKTFFNWSSGKDASLALFRLMQDNAFDVQRLLTTVNGYHNRVSMHGLRHSLLQAQASAIGIPLQVLELPEQPSMSEYDALMSKTLEGLKKEGFEAAAFGDIFLEDLRKYREEKLKAENLDVVFPLWKEDTHLLVRSMITLGFKMITVCVNGNLLDESFVGREVDASFLSDLPGNVDPCGENGEFHTFCYDGPVFKTPVAFETGEKVLRTYENPDKTAGEKWEVWFCDLLPKN